MIRTSAYFIILMFASAFALPAPLYLWKASSRTDENLQKRITTPAGFRRVAAHPGSFAEWLRNLPLKPGRPPVFLHDGKQKGNQDAHHAVLDIDTGNRDLQQCADAVMRLRAEYLFSIGNFDAIHFRFTSGDQAAFSRWAEGFRPSVRGNVVIWRKIDPRDSSYENFRRYLNTVFLYAGSYSLSREAKSIDRGELQPGDFFIQGGFPGHAVLVADLAVDDSNNKIFLLLQSYMPAQDIHLLNNPEDLELSPWYRLDFGETLKTPEWTFGAGDLKRFQ